MGIIGFKTSKSHHHDATVVIASDRLEDGSLKTVAHTSQLPKKAPTDTLILLRDTAEPALYAGTGNGIMKITAQVKVETGSGAVDLSAYLSKKDAEATYATKEELKTIEKQPGKSAFEIAKENGYDGNSAADWIASLKGKTGDPGKSAYEIAKDGGYTDTKENWLASLKGETGARGEAGQNGESAFEIAKKHGYSGTDEAAWIASLKGPKGNDGAAGLQGPAGKNGEMGPMGPAGKSAYQIAKEKGYTDTEEKWLESLKAAATDISDCVKKSELTGYVTTETFTELKNAFDALKKKVEEAHPAG